MTHGICAAHRDQARAELADHPHYWVARSRALLKHVAGALAGDRRHADPSKLVEDYLDEIAAAARPIGDAPRSETANPAPMA